MALGDAFAPVELPLHYDGDKKHLPTDCLQVFDAMVERCAAADCRGIAALGWPEHGMDIVVPFCMHHLFNPEPRAKSETISAFALRVIAETQGVTGDWQYGGGT